MKACIFISILILFPLLSIGQARWGTKEVLFEHQYEKAIDVLETYGDFIKTDSVPQYFLSFFDLGGNQHQFVFRSGGDKIDAFIYYDDKSSVPYYLSCYFITKEGIIFTGPEGSDLSSWAQVYIRFGFKNLLSYKEGISQTH